MEISTIICHSHARRRLTAAPQPPTGEEESSSKALANSLETICQMIGSTLQNAEPNRHNVIIRPRSTTATLIQLDDLDERKVKWIAPNVFMVIGTSPGNYQAWVAVEPGAPEDFSRRLRKGAGADATASGATPLVIRLFRHYISPAQLSF